VWDQTLPILLGFVLTTIIGGLFASLLQQRSWSHQNELRLREEDLTRAGNVCQTLSALVDKRWYRMQRLLFGIVGRAEGTVTREVLEARLSEYDQVLFEWNDELNARLAIVGAYFGRDLRDFLDRVVYEEFKDAGQQLEALYHAVASGNGTGLEPDATAPARTKLDTLNNVAYQLSFAMMIRIREGKVGRRAPAVIGETAISEIAARDDLRQTHR
jgi:hypothetical protein